MPPPPGLLEHYQWLYGLIGGYLKLDSNADSEIGIDVRLTRMLWAEIDVKSVGGVSCTGDALDLGKETNFRIAMPWKLKRQNSLVWLIEPYIEQWDIGRSNTKEITCGLLSGFVIEPRSTTRNFGVNIQMVMPL